VTQSPALKRSLRSAVSTFLVEVRQRLRISWTSSSLRRNSRTLARAEKRLALLALETDLQHLRVKELQEVRQVLLHRQEETQAATEYRLQKKELPKTELPPELTTEMPAPPALRRVVDQGLLIQRAASARATRPSTLPTGEKSPQP